MTRKRLQRMAPLVLGGAAPILMHLGCTADMVEQATNSSPPPPQVLGTVISSDPIQAHATTLMNEGRFSFQSETFGSEAFWGDELQLHRVIAGSNLGGIGPGLSPNALLAMGLKLDRGVIPAVSAAAFEAGEVDLNDPAVTVQLLRDGAVVGLRGIFDSQGAFLSVGIQCALCHTTVDDSLAPGIGLRRDGWANRDLNVGSLLAVVPDLTPLADVLQISQDEMRSILTAWGPGKFDATLFLDGKGFTPDGKSAATLIPPVFGLAGVNLGTWTGWGSVTHWNAMVASVQMQGQGTFYDPRLNDPVKYPVAARTGAYNVRPETDRTTIKLAGLHYYQLSLPAPAAPVGSFDVAASERGAALFSGKANCSRCHVAPLYTEPGWNLHTPAEIGIDSFQADRSPDGRYRTAPLRGLWTHTTGGFYHDGRFATLADVINHYNEFFQLQLTSSEMADLAEFLKSL